MTLLNSSLKDHFCLFDKNRNDYVTNILEIFTNKTNKKTTPTSVQARILTVLIHKFDRETMGQLYKYIDLPEICRACEILDANRSIKQYMKKKATHKNKDLISTNKELVEDCFELRLTSSKIKIVKRWIKQLTREDLEYRAIMFSTDLWKKLCDLLHTNPKDFAVDWFQTYCFTGEAPKDSVVGVINGLTIYNFLDIYGKYALSYENIRQKLNLSKTGTNYLDHEHIDQIKLAIAKKEKMETVLWYYHELKNTAVDAYLYTELKNYSIIDLCYSKLVELLTKVENKNLLDELIRIATNCREKYNINIPKPVAVFGDASASMSVAIKTSAIITSLLTYLTDAQLDIFKNVNYHIYDPPKTVRESLDLIKKMHADSSTSPASSLYYYYEKKIPIKTFIIVTDEGENTGYNGQNNWYNTGNSSTTFSALFMRYRAEIYNAKLIFISFTDPNKDGQMVRELRGKLGKECDEYVKTFKFDVNNPDLTRMDTVLAYMCKQDTMAEQATPIQVTLSAAP